MQGLIFIEPEKCLACRSCEIQCAVSHSRTKIFFQALEEESIPLPRIKVEEIGKLTWPKICRHCKDAPCVEACPTHALEKENTGPVIIKNELCDSCKKCISACPFGIINWDGKGQGIIKCDLCIERLQKDEIPACVEACPTGALQFIPWEEKGEKLYKAEGSRYLVNLIKRFSIQEEICIGCGACRRVCPQEAIVGERRKPHRIDYSLCIKCGACVKACRYEAITLE